MENQKNSFRITPIEGGKIYEKLDPFEKVVAMVFVPDQIPLTATQKVSKQADGFNFLLGALSRLMNPEGSRVRPDEIKRSVMVSWELMGLEPDEFTKKYFSLPESE